MKRSIYTLFFTALTFVGYGQAGSVLSIKTIEHNDVGVVSSQPAVFGSSSTSLGDLNNDGTEDIAIGAMFSGPTSNQGIVYIIFLDSTGGVLDTTKIGFGLSGFNGVTGFEGRFGAALTYLGDIDNDGTIELAVGNPFKNGQGNKEGVLWILSLDQNGTVQKSVEIGEGKGGFIGSIGNEDRFGGSLSYFPDVDNDGVPELLVGAYDSDIGTNNTGSIYLLKLNANGTVKAHSVFDNNTLGMVGALQSNFSFGESVAATADIDGNGVAEIIAGVPGDDIAYLNRGAIWILFLDTQLNITTISRIHGNSVGLSTYPDSISYFGRSIATADDIDGDGIDDIFIGSSEGYINPSSTNLVHVVFLSTQGTIKNSALLTASSGTPFSQFNAPNVDFAGFALSVLKDVNVDGKRDLLAGAPAFNNAQGQIHILTLDGVSHISLEEKAIESNSISIFPNPSSGSFSVSLSQEFLHQEMQMVLLDASGRKLWEKKVENLQTPQMELELKQPAGIYYLHCKAGGLVAVSKVIISN